MLWNGQSLLSQTHKKTCNSFFIRSKFHPNSPRDFTTQTANLLLSPLPEQCFPPYVTLYENASALGIFAISSQPLKYGSRYYTGHESGTQQWLKSEEMWAGRAFDKPLSPKWHKAAFLVPGSGKVYRDEYHTLGAGQLVPKSGNGFIWTVSCQTVPFMFLSTFLIALCLEKYSTDWKYCSQAQIIPSRCKNISLK